MGLIDPGWTNKLRDFGLRILQVLWLVHWKCNQVIKPYDPRNQNNIHTQKSMSLEHILLLGTCTFVDFQNGLEHLPMLPKAYWKACAWRYRAPQLTQHKVIITIAVYNDHALLLLLHFNKWLTYHFSSLICSNVALVFLFEKYWINLAPTCERKSVKFLIVKWKQCPVERCTAI